MKKIVLVSLFVFGSLLANAQNFKTHPKKPYSPTDSCLVWQDSTKRFYRIKCSEINTGGSSAIDTTKVGRIEQGRGTAPIFMYFNGVAWVRNDTSYIPRSGASNITGNLKRIGSSFRVGLNSDNSYIDFGDYNTQIITQGGVSGANIQIGSGASSSVSLNVGSGSVAFTVNSDSPTRLNNQYLTSNEVYRTNDSLRYIQLKDAQERFAPISGTQSTTLADGKVWIGDGTNTAFPRTLSGDVTVSNLGVTTLATVNSNVGTFGGATQTPVLVANGKGLITSVSNTTVTPAVSSITGLGTGVATWLATPSSANLLTAVTDETGTGATVFGTSPTFTTDITTPLIVGGTATTSPLTYKTTTGVGTTGADHIFKVGNNGATEAMRILNSGYVGIGINAPTSQLHVKGSAGTTAPVIGGGSLYLQDNGASPSNGGSILFGASQGYFAGIKSQITDGSNNTIGSLLFYTRLVSTDANLTEALKIQWDGKIGIGTTSPSTKLHVVGDVSFVGKHKGVTNLGGFLRLDGYTFTGTSGNYTAFDMQYITVSYARINNSVVCNIGGVYAKPDGTIIYFSNVGSANVTFKNESAGDAASDRFLTVTGADVVVPVNGSFNIRYDATSARWRQF